MFKHRVESYWCQDANGNKSVLVAVRNDDRTDQTIINNAHFREDVKSPFYVKVRNGEYLAPKQVMFTGLSQKDARLHQKAMIKAFQAVGVTVLNQKNVA